MPTTGFMGTYIHRVLVFDGYLYSRVYGMSHTTYGITALHSSTHTQSLLFPWLQYEVKGLSIRFALIPSIEEFGRDHVYVNKCTVLCIAT